MSLKERTEVKHAEIAWIPICVPENGKPWFWATGVRGLRREARDNFAKCCSVDWAVLRKEGWQIVRIKITTELH